MIACGLDFGTSNSAIGVMRNGVAELAPIEADNTLMPSAVFFDYETRGACYWAMRRSWPMPSRPRVG